MIRSSLRITSRLAVAFFFLALPLGMSGCASLSGAPHDPATGDWEGSWYGSDPTTPAGWLKCHIEPAGKDRWSAVFSAGFGGEASYDVELVGRREGDRVVFGGGEDLGETSGGIFNFIGAIEGDDFSGDYTSQFINGTFKMTRVKDGEGGEG